MTFFGFHLIQINNATENSREGLRRQLRLRRTIAESPTRGQGTVSANRELKIRGARQKKMAVRKQPFTKFVNLNLFIHGSQEFFVAFGGAHVLQHKTHRFFRVHIGEVFTQDIHFAHYFFA